MAPAFSAPFFTAALSLDSASSDHASASATAAHRFDPRPIPRRLQESPPKNPRRKGGWRFGNDPTIFLPPTSSPHFPTPPPAIKKINTESQRHCSDVAYIFLFLSCSTRFKEIPPIHSQWRIREYILCYPPSPPLPYFQIKKQEAWHTNIQASGKHWLGKTPQESP